MREAPLLPLLLLVGLGACGQTDRAAGENPTAPNLAQSPPPALPSSPVERVISLSGDWRVAGIDGSSLNEAHGLALRGDDSELWWEPRCAGMVRGYKIVGHSITFRSLQPSPPGSPTPPVCEIGLPPRLDEVFAALDVATTVGRTPENGIQIAGGGHSVTLFSQ